MDRLGDQLLARPALADDEDARRRVGDLTERIEYGEDLSPDGQVALLEALERAVHSMLKTHGRIDIPWGDLHRIQRGSRSWPVGGLRADGVSTLRSVRFSSPDSNGVSQASGGQICTTVVLLQEGNVSSYSLTQFGQSDDPESPHFADQAEKLFSPARLKPTWYGKTDLLRNLESKQTLEFSGTD